jgi:putative hemolysin
LLLTVPGFFILLFLAGAFLLTAVNSALRRLHKREALEELRKIGSLFFYNPFHLLFFSSHPYESMTFATICGQNITRFCYTISILLYLFYTGGFEHAFRGDASSQLYSLEALWLALSLLGFILIAFMVSDYLPRILGFRYPKLILKICTPLASPFLFLVFPLTYIFLKVSEAIPRIAYLEPAEESSHKEEILEMLEKADRSTHFDPHEKKLIQSVIGFKERIAREVMVPRVDVFSLPAEMSIKEAAKRLKSEGYSRTPLYKQTIDNIVGVLMYKDVLNKYMEYEQTGKAQLLDAPVETIQKNILHAPETKKISSLLQEFRKKQVHFAIVVDEYGGTAGIVTIEDILEEIVGEIADEYDQEQELFYAQPDGSWIVDAKMNILDIEEELGFKLLQEGEYDTIGGYIFHTTGTIPPKGFVIHHDAFDLEILKSNDRCVEKVRMKAPRK